MRRGTALGLGLLGLLTCTWWPPAAAGRCLLGQPKKVSAKRLEAFLVKHTSFSWELGTHSFQPKGQMDYGNANAVAAGQYQVRSDDVHMSGFGDDEVWRDVRLVGDWLLIVDQVEENGKKLPGSTYACRKEGRHSYCHTRKLLSLRPGKPGSALFDEVCEHLSEKSPGEDWVMVADENTKNPRETSEIWYTGAGLKKDAARIAEQLAPLIGPVAPKPWTWGGPYRVLVIVGERKAGPAQVPK